MEKPQILMWILLWKEGKNLVYLYEKLSILSIGGARLIFMNSSKRPTKSLIKKWDVVMSSLFAWRYSLSQYKRTLVYLERPKLVGFQTYVILDPNGMTFDAVGVFGLDF